MNMKNYFDEYFDMVYFINIPSRKDKYENVMNMFNRLNITKYKYIIPVDCKTLINNYGLVKEAQSCKLAHLECYKDAIDNNYEHICIFEDDVCFNVDDTTIEQNLEYHLEMCFMYLKNYKWNLFYFDNISEANRNNNIMKSYSRLPKNNSFTPFSFVTGKGYTHSYALSKYACYEMIQMIKECDNGPEKHVDNLLRRVNVPYKVVYLPGIFDQLIDVPSDNVWVMRKNK